MPGFKPFSATAQSNQGGEQKEAPSESLAAPTSPQSQTPSQPRELLRARGAAERDRGDPRAIRVPTPGIGRAAAPAAGPARPDAHPSHSREAAAAVAAPGHPGLCHPPREIYGGPLWAGQMSALHPAQHPAGSDPASPGKRGAAQPRGPSAAGASPALPTPCPSASR